ncbi:Disease resistance protein RPM1 [Panicum miliaceum]|uniref:Disease resistance protein RPM1 n=1 Tax=Panicum miliaceum TaxID=4540 RepID=A0A3L6SFQ1_PANMI|nr:Disease resistance protein RPM1 [Panicum miliaceum]
MAAVADAFASKLIVILKRMPKKEVETLLRAPGEITKLETALRVLSPILADAERRRIRDSSAERWMREVKDAMYDADDILDICQILESGEDPMLAERSAPWRRNIPLSSCFNNQVVPHQIGIKIKALNRKLEDVMRRSSNKVQFTLQAIGSTRYSSYSETGPVFLEPDIVGEKIQEDRRKLCDLLVNSMDAPTRSVIDNVVVVAITGAAGIGKTTLARMVFNDRMLDEYFQVKIWLCVTQEVNGIRLLRQIIAYVDGNEDGVADSMHMLQERLNLALRQKRFLLVMDDVWSDKVWNDILRAPLDGGAPGSRVLVTTRNDEAARGMRAQHLHRVTTLDPDDSWLLLKKQVSLAEDERDIDDLKYIGMMIIEKCNGLPLAIKVIGGLLRTKARTRDSWFGVLNHYLGSSGAQLGELFHSLYLSYQDLSPQLKQCFLYCSLLPKGVNFESPNVINMWISEGFIHLAARRADELEDIGTEYHQDLIMRHLIEPGASSSMHDIVRSFAQHMAREEALVVQRELQTETARLMTSLMTTMIFRLLGRQIVGVDLFNDDSELVGIESPREQIIEMLMQGRHTDKQQLQVVSIYGIEGLGKTNIARSVYRQISNRFECCAQVSVSERPDIVGIMKSIIDQVRCPYSSVEEFSNMQDNLQVIINVLEEFLEDKRYLIFTDDIWEVSVWETIKPAFIGNNHGSGIIATTYKLDVAKSIGGVYTLPLLSDEDSKILFYRRTCFRSEAGCPSSYRDVSKRLLNKCSRLPLAIITITRLLPASLNSEEEWKKVCNSIDSGFELGDRVRDMRRILSRSYHDLPQQTCFLYLSIFPENYDIRRESLVQRWLSEGLIRGDHGQNLHELGESYFYQLLDTGMIQPIEFDNDGNALACRVPLVMIDLIAYLLIKEKHNTTSASQRRTDPPNKVERLSLQVAEAPKSVGTAAGTISLSAKETTKSFREGSLSISCSSDSVGTRPIIKNLRVLVLEGSLEDRHIAKYLGRSSRQLRYLILASTQITVIPKKVGNLQFLQTLDLRATRVIELPRTFVRLKQLQCLLINRSTKVPAGTSNLQALKELQDIDISKSPDILEGICTLSKLRVLKAALWSWDDSSSKFLPETLCKLSTSELEHLFISTCCSLEFKPNDDVQKVFQHITKLEVQHSTFNTLPTWIDKLKKLSSLSIEVYLLEEDALRILGGLPALLFLSLTAKKTPEARPTAKRTPDERVVTEDKLVVRSNGFGCLKTFHLFSRAMVIKFEKGSMKSLERLKLSFQASLATEDFSFGLGNLSSLKHIQVEIICFSATEKAVKKAEDAIRDMIWGSSGQPRPTLDIRRSAEEYKIEDKKEFREEVRELSLASRDGRTASVQKQNQKQKID